MKNVRISHDMIEYYGLQVAKFTIHESTHRDKFAELLTRENIIDGDKLKELLIKEFGYQTKSNDVTRIFDIIDDLIHKSN